VEEPVLNKLISRIEAGGHVHLHTDQLMNLQKNALSKGRVLAHVDPGLLQNGENFRCNIMVQMDNATACPVIEDEIVEVAAGDSWGFLASQWRHGTQLVTGMPRIIYGFGFIVPTGFNADG
jgi:hypothetical protein